MKLIGYVFTLLLSIKWSNQFKTRLFLTAGLKVVIGGQ